MRIYYVYIMASHTRVLYTGVTNDLVRRVGEHRRGDDPKAFTARYRATKLVYYEEFRSILDAIAREKEIKSWRRSRRVRLIVARNPKWEDLSLPFSSR